MKRPRIILLICLQSIFLCSFIANGQVLHLSFDNHLLGANGETPSSYNEINPVEFEAGVKGFAAYFTAQNVLKYASDNNINTLRGTLCYWIKPNWNGTNDHKVFTMGGTGGMH